ncbi:MAG: hypothetical protein CVV25_10735 [Ignavibacteriae bacterium HGW-Ignavibacteriae-4]|jgi:hypothetical protein|nr:MAG: hypothetical protein CVV25_10735 [Ignavibacteriae bacterium HGW-Ignavibacteriae-4]
MKNIIISIITILILTAPIYSQDKDKTIGNDGSRYTYQGKQINMNQMLSLMEKDSEEFELMSSGKSTGGLVTVLSTIGGGLIGWPLGTYLGGGEPNWNIALIGGAFVVISIPFAIGADNDIKKAVEMHNLKQALTDNQGNYELRFFATSNGFGLSLQF